MSKCLPLSSEPVLHPCVGVKCGEMKGKLQPDIRDWGLLVEKQWGYFPFLKTAESCGCAAVWSSKAPVCWETGISASPTIDPLSPEHWSRKESFCSLNLGDWQQGVSYVAFQITDGFMQSNTVVAVLKISTTWCLCLASHMGVLKIQHQAMKKPGSRTRDDSVNQHPHWCSVRWLSFKLNHDVSLFIHLFLWQISKLLL